jgi:hypothetical protein
MQEATHFNRQSKDYRESLNRYYYLFRPAAL